MDQNYFSHTDRYPRLLQETDSPRVLLAEDDNAMRRMLASILQQDGYEVIQARNGAQLFDLMNSQLIYACDRAAVDLIISDIRMPEMSGLEVLAALRDADWSTPVILLTAFGEQTTRDEALRLGAQAIFSKPFDIDELRATVGRVLTSHL